MEDFEKETAVAPQQGQRTRGPMLLFMGYLSPIDERRALLQTRRSRPHTIATAPRTDRDHIVPYIPSSHETASRMLELAEVRPSDVIYDLGCGDARILILATSSFNASEGVGYEIRREVYKIALKEVRDRNLEEKITIVNRDLFDADISKATVIALYLDYEAVERLKPKLQKEASRGTKIVSHDFEIRGWRPVKKAKCGGDYIYLYKTPDCFEQA